MKSKHVMKFEWSILVLALLAAVPGRAQNPVPFISQPLVPSAAVPCGPSFTLTVNGAGFTGSSVVNWNSRPLATTFVSSDQIAATVPFANIASPGTAAITVSSGEVTSNVAYFEITGPTAAISLSDTLYAVGILPESVAVGDFNADGKLDLATANQGGNVSVLLGNGEGTFQPAVNYTAGENPFSVAVGDFNGDGKLDLVIANLCGNDPSTCASGTVSVLLGKGDGSFQSAVDYAVGTQPSSVAVGDFNGDGKLDLAVVTDRVSVLLGNGDGTFQPPVNYTAGAGPSTVAVGDFNGDGKLDLAVANLCGDFPTCTSSGTVLVLLGNGDGTFQAAVNYAVGAYSVSLAVSDFNGDGMLDLAAANGRDNNVSVLFGNGDGTFQAAVNYPAGTHPNSIAAGDLNGDGKLDLAAANGRDNSVSVLFGNGDGTFQTAANYTAGTDPISVAAGDFNGDGRMDLAAANNRSNNVTILLQPTPPPPPSGCVAQLNGGNTFAGNQTVNGTVTATSFIGDGSQLTGIAAATAATATNALNLGNVPASNFARLDIPNAFKGDQNVTGSLTATGTITANSFTGSGAGLTGIALLSSNSFNTTQTISSGDLFLSAGNLNLPETSGATAGVINLGRSAFIHACCGNSKNNTFVGVLAGNFGATGYQNTGLGVSALRWATTGNDNTATGFQALNYNNAGSQNTAMGSQALGVNTDGKGNVALGYLAGVTGTAANGSTQGSYNTFLGFQSGPGTPANLTNAIAIGANALVSENNALVLGGTGDYAVKVGIGTEAPAFTLDVQGDARFTQPVTFASGQTFPGTGTITGVTAGTGLTGGGTGGNVAVSVDQGVVALQTDLATGVAAAEAFATAAATTAQNNATTYANNTFLPLTGGTITKDLNVSGNSATAGTVKIGSGGAAISGHFSITVNPAFPALKPATCASGNFDLQGAADGDTTALGVPNGRMTGGGILIYTAWVSASNTVTVQACNVGANPQKTAGTGSIRIDLWKH